MGEDIRVTGGNNRRTQQRKVRKDGFTDEKRQIYLDTLAGCATVCRAAQAAGVSVETVNYHRRRDPVWAQQCAEALETAYTNLEADKVAAAAAGGHYVPGPGAADAPGPGSVDHDLALQLLRLRRRPLGQRTGRAGYEPKRATEKELNEAIIAQLDVLSKRIRKSKPPASGRRAGG
ncbi:MAG TPA: hypothetical protein VF759_06290 [Allosphingosinicella sp.]